MAVEAPLSKHKKTNLKIYIVLLIGLAVWCAYDGYFNEKWIEEHKDADGNPETYLVFNRNAPPFLGAAAVLIGIYLFAIKNNKLIADENGIATGKKTVTYNSIEKIDKTHFDSKGYFVVTYKNENNGERRLKLDDRTYDNLSAILDELVAKIS